MGSQTDAIMSLLEKVSNMKCGGALVREIQHCMAQQARVSNPAMMAKKFPDEGALRLELGSNWQCVHSLQNRKEN